MSFKPCTKINLLVCLSWMIFQSAYSISISKPAYITLGTGVGSSNKKITFQTYGAKDTATISVDRLSFTTANNMSYQQELVTLTPKSGLGFNVMFGAVDARTGVGVEGEFGYSSTSSDEFLDSAGNNFIPTNLNGTEGATDADNLNPAAANAAVKFSNFKRSGGLKSLRTALNFLFFPNISKKSTDFYVGAGAGFGQSGVYFKRSADVQYRAANGTYGTAVRQTLGPEIKPRGWNSLFQGFVGLRIPYESDSAFDIRINYIYGNTKELETGLYGYTNTTTAINIPSQQGMTQANYTTPATVISTAGVQNPLRDTTRHQFDQISITLSASFSPY